MSSLGSVDATNLCISLYVNFVVLSKIFWLMTNKIMKIVDAVSNNFTVLNSGNNKIKYFCERKYSGIPKYFNKLQLLINEFVFFN